MRKKDVVEHGVLYAKKRVDAYRTLCSTTQSLVDIGDFFSAFREQTNLLQRDKGVNLAALLLGTGLFVILKESLYFCNDK